MEDIEILSIEEIIRYLEPPVCSHKHVCLFRLAKHPLPKPQEYVYKSTQISWCDWGRCVVKADLDPQSSSSPRADHRAFSKACFCELFLSPQQQRGSQTTKMEKSDSFLKPLILKKVTYHCSLLIFCLPIFLSCRAVILKGGAAWLYAVSLQMTGA